MSSDLVDVSFDQSRFCFLIFEHKSDSALLVMLQKSRVLKSESVRAVQHVELLLGLRGLGRCICSADGGHMDFSVYRLERLPAQLFL